jgi:hypothetical protein
VRPRIVDQNATKIKLGPIAAYSCPVAAGSSRSKRSVTTPRAVRVGDGPIALKAEPIESSVKNR